MIGVLLKLGWNEFRLQSVWIGPYFFQTQFYEENNHAFVKSNIFSLLKWYC